MAPDPAVFAEMVTLTIKAALAPILERVAEQSAQVKQALAVEAAVTSLRERLVVLETKAAAPPIVVPEPQDLTPVLERMAGLDARVARLAAVELSVGELHDKCMTLETKAAMAGEPDVPLIADVEGRVLHQIDLLRSDLRDVENAVRAVETKTALPHEMPPSGPSAAELELTIRDAVEPLKATLATLGERIAVLEVRPLLPGPTGKDGKDGAPGLDGKDGAPGLNGKDGLAGLSYEGVYQEGKAYEPGHLATWGGSTWHCNEPTTSKPGETAQAWTLMVKRGRDGKDGKDAEIVPVVSLGAGRR